LRRRRSPAGRRGAEPSTGRGRVSFSPNPSRPPGQTLTDQKDADYPALQPAYRTVHADEPRRQRLSSATARTSQRDRRPAYSPTNTFTYTRDDDRFEQVMAYYWITEAQKYIQSLGFGDAAAGEQESAGRPHQPVGLDNSFATTSRTSCASARAASTTPRTPR
jgi:hypothetical protein